LKDSANVPLPAWFNNEIVTSAQEGWIQ
jgi:hypothetical protein